MCEGLWLRMRQEEACLVSPAVPAGCSQARRYGVSLAGPLPAARPESHQIPIHLREHDGDVFDTGVSLC
jgi:hypothetical protein